MLKYQFPAVKGCQAGKDYYGNTAQRKNMI